MFVHKWLYMFCVCVGWVNNGSISENDGSISYSKLIKKGSTVELICSIEIKADLQWQVHVKASLHLRFLFNLSISKWRQWVMCALKLKFKILVHSRKGNFMNTTGMNMFLDLAAQVKLWLSLIHFSLIIFVQVLSQSVAKGLELLKKEEFQETIKFIDFFDKWLDCLNVTNFDSGKRTRNPFKSPHRSKKDFRLEVHCVLYVCIYCICLYTNRYITHRISVDISMTCIWC